MVSSWGCLREKTRITQRHGIKPFMLLPSCISKISTWKISWCPNDPIGTMLIETYSKDTLSIDSLTHVCAVPLGPWFPGAISIGVWGSLTIQFLSNYLTYFLLIFQCESFKPWLVYYVVFLEKIFGYLKIAKNHGSGLWSLLDTTSEGEKIIRSNEQILWNSDSFHSYYWQHKISIFMIIPAFLTL